MTFCRARGRYNRYCPNVLMLVFLLAIFAAHQARSFSQAVFREGSLLYDAPAFDTMWNFGSIVFFIRSTARARICDIPPLRTRRRSCRILCKRMLVLNEFYALLRHIRPIIHRTKSRPLLHRSFIGNLYAATIKRSLTNIRQRSRKRYFFQRIARGKGIITNTLQRSGKRYSF